MWPWPASPPPAPRSQARAGTWRCSAPTRATGTVPTLTPGSICTLTIVRDGQTLPHTGATLTFTTSLDVIAPEAPAAPTNLAATTGNASLAIAFTLPDEDGSPFTTLEYSLDGTTWSEAASTTSPLHLAGLTNEEPVTVRLRAQNAAGIGPASDPITATPTLWPFATRAVGTSVDVAAGGGASPAIVDNLFRENGRFAIVYLEASAGAARGNRCEGGGGIVLLWERAQPRLEANVCELQDRRPNRP